MSATSQINNERLEALKATILATVLFATEEEIAKSFFEIKAMKEGETELGELNSAEKAIFHATVLKREEHDKMLKGLGSRVLSLSEEEEEKLSFLKNEHDILNNLFWQTTRLRFNANHIGIRHNNEKFVMVEMPKSPEEDLAEMFSNMFGGIAVIRVGKF